MIKHKIVCVGCGGIGSVLASQLNFLVMTDQIDLSQTEIILADHDNVEIKNIKYQLFNTKDILKNKAKVLGDRYSLAYRQYKVTGKELGELKPTIILICVDNSETRKIVYDYCSKNDCYYIDGRAEGRAVAIFTKHPENTKERMDRSLDMSRGDASCQLEKDLASGKMERGNFIVAMIMSQLLLNYLRGEKNLPMYNYHF